MTLTNNKRLVFVVGMAVAMMFALATNAFAAITSGTISGPATTTRVYKTVDLVPGDTLVINQQYGTKVCYTVSDAATGKYLVTAYGSTYTGFSGTVANVVSYKNSGTAPLSLTIQVDYATYSNMLANVNYSAPASTTTFATGWQAYSLPSVSVAPGRTYTCVLTKTPSLSDTLYFRVNGVATGSASGNTVGPVWSYTNTGSTAVTVSMVDSIPWATMTATQVSAAGSLAGTLYY